MIKTLFVFNLKENKGMIIGFTLIILLYSTISIGMYDPSSSEALEAMLQMVPEALLKMLGFISFGTEITSYVAHYLYGFIMVLFPAIFIIILGNRLIGKYQNQGSLVYLITMPYSRKKIVVTQLIFLITTLFFVLFINVAVMMIMASVMFPKTLQIGPFLMLNLVTFGVHFMLAGLTFFLSIWIADSTQATGLSSLLLIGFFIIKMLSEISEATQFLKYLSPYSLIHISHLLAGGIHGLLELILTLIIGVAFFIGSVVLFDKKSIIV